MNGFELRHELRSLEEFRALRAQFPHIIDRATIDALVRRGLAEGISSPFLGTVAPEAMASATFNYRESFNAHGFSPRVRAVLDFLAFQWPATVWPRLRLHVHEAVTPFALLIRGKFPYALASEYLPTPEEQAARFPIPHVDICRSGLPDATFDAILSNEVLEHVPSIDDALQDMARILKPDGYLIATFPFRYNNDESVRRARLLADGQVEHLLAPEYLGNPVNPQGGSLVFEVPGWDIVPRARAAGFRDAFVVFDGSTSRGVTGAEIAGILMFVAIR